MRRKGERREHEHGRSSDKIERGSLCNHLLLRERTGSCARALLLRSPQSHLPGANHQTPHSALWSISGLLPLYATILGQRARLHLQFTGPSRASSIAAQLHELLVAENSPLSWTSTTAALFAATQLGYPLPDASLPLNEITRRYGQHAAALRWSTEAAVNTPFSGSVSLSRLCPAQSTSFLTAGPPLRRWPRPRTATALTPSALALATCLVPSFRASALSSPRARTPFSRDSTESLSSFCSRDAAASSPITREPHSTRAYHRST